MCFTNEEVCAWREWEMSAGCINFSSIVYSEPDDSFQGKKTKAKQTNETNKRIPHKINKNPSQNKTKNPQNIRDKTN